MNHRGVSDRAAGGVLVKIQNERAAPLQDAVRDFLLNAARASVIGNVLDGVDRERRDAAVNAVQAGELEIGGAVVNVGDCAESGMRSEGHEGGKLAGCVLTIWLRRDGLKQNIG